MNEALDPGGLFREVGLVVADVRDGILSGDSPAWLSYSRSYNAAESNARARSGSVGLAAARIARWLIISTVENEDYDRAFQMATEVLERLSPDDPLAAELHNLVTQYAAGSISLGQFVKRTDKPFQPRQANPSRRRSTLAALALDDVAGTLRKMLEDATTHSHAADPSAAWEVFKAFAQQEVEARAPKRIGQDGCLFQWGVYGMSGRPLFYLDYTRQFSIDDENGTYDSMQQIHLTILFEPLIELYALDRGELWAKDDLQEWFNEVEKLEAFTVPQEIADPIEIVIEQEEV